MFSKKIFKIFQYSVLRFFLDYPEKIVYTYFVSCK